MKQVLFSILCICSLTICSKAQQAKEVSGKHVVKAFKSSKKPNRQKLQNLSKLDSRKNYKWKNGQEATPSGQQATSTNGESFSIMNSGKARPSNIKH